MENQVIQSSTIYPHPAQIQKVNAWSPDPNFQSKAVAGVTLRYGPISIRAKLIQGEKRLFLSMPSRKNETTGDFWEHASISDRTLLEEFEKQAIAAYYAETGLVAA